MATPKRILLVEDDHFTRFMMKEIIQTLDVPVDVAKNGQDGCDRLDKDPDSYGLVLMDIHMPIMSGIDAATKIRAAQHDPPRNVAIYAVTNDQHYLNDDVISKHGMDGFIAKPITAGELLSLVDQFCGTD